MRTALPQICPDIRKYRRAAYSQHKDIETNTRGRHTGKQTYSTVHTYRHRDIKIHRNTERQKSGIHTNTQIHRETNEQTDRHTDSERHTERHTDTDRHLSQTDTHTCSVQYMRVRRTDT